MRRVFPERGSQSRDPDRYNLERTLRTGAGLLFAETKCLWFAVDALSKSRCVPSRDETF